MRKDISKRINGARSDRKQLSKLRAVLTKGDIDCHRLDRYGASLSATIGLTPSRRDD